MSRPSRQIALPYPLYSFLDIHAIFVLINAARLANDQTAKQPYVATFGAKDVFPDYFSGASGRRSITYLPFATLMIGTPGTFLILLFRSLSFVATR